MLLLLPARSQRMVKMNRCETTIYRGQSICKHSLHKHEAVAAESGPNFKLSLIQGSFSPGYDDSAGTHDGGAVSDYELDGYSWDTAWKVSKLYRKKLMLDWIRWWKGNHHGHSADPECPNMAPELVAQFIEFGKGGDGLVGELKDPGDRTYASQIMELFNNRRSYKSRVKLIQRGLGLTVDGVWGQVTDAVISKVRAEKKAGVRAVQTGLLVDADGAWGSVTDAAYLKLRSAVFKPVTLDNEVKPPAPTTTTVIDKTVPYGPFPYPNGKTSTYGPSKPGTNQWSGRVPSRFITLVNIRKNIRLIQKKVGVVQDGIFGTQTFNAVKRWQKSHGLFVDGLVGPVTWSKMAKTK